MAALAGQGIGFWDYSDLDQSISPGEEIRKRLFQEIDRAMYMVVLISNSSLDPLRGSWCLQEMEHAIASGLDQEGRFIPVLLVPKKDLHYPFPGSHLNEKLHFHFLNTPESVVEFTILICRKLNKNYLPPVEAHPNLPFWKLFREEVMGLAHSNNYHLELMKTLGEFNEYYKKYAIEKSFDLISYFLITCKIKIPDYQPYYPLLVRAVCETELELLDQALETYCEAERIHPSDQDAIGGKGTVYFKMKLYHEALSCFERIIRDTHVTNKTNARINLIITKLSMEKTLSQEEEKFLFAVNDKDYAMDLKINVGNARSMVLKMHKDYQKLEDHCAGLIKEHLYDTITIKLYCIGLFNHGKKGEAQNLLIKAIDDSNQNQKLDKTELERYMHELFR